ncbi:MAG: YraN family protein [Gammaproteobacteria bacterium]|nr:YraN family protein [Gammaproteobacteria bacterium]NNJ80250.1 YraN family protein [Xanthomonadales bacterium]
MPSTRQQGSDWERAAERMLKKRGLRCLNRNYHARVGEIDLIMLQEETLVFVEVRYRSNPNYGSGADSVTAQKQGRVIQAARRFLQREKQHAWRPCRFDVVSIGDEEGEPVMTWIRRAFEAA